MPSKARRLKEKLKKEMTDTEEIFKGLPDDLPEIGKLNKEAPVVFETPDPWAGRKAWMKCSWCVFFVLKGSGDLGRCRRHAPTTAGYPQVYRSDWCGDMRVDEGKI